MTNSLNKIIMWRFDYPEAIACRTFCETIFVLASNLGTYGEQLSFSAANMLQFFMVQHENQNEAQKACHKTAFNDLKLQKTLPARNKFHLNYKITQELSGTRRKALRRSCWNDKLTAPTHN